MYTREELEKWNCEGLAQYCKENDIPHYNGKNRFRKAEMVEAILNHQKSDKGKAETEEVAEKYEEVESAIERPVAIDYKVKKEYIENAEPGTLIAFKEKSGKANTAALVNRSSKNEKLKLITKYGKEFIVAYTDVLWVKVNPEARWPRGIFELLKGGKKNEEKATDK